MLDSNAPGAVPPTRRSPLLALFGFVVLDLIFTAPELFGLGPLGYLGCYAAFFVAAHLVARALGDSGLASLGLRRHAGWGRNLGVGLLLGALAWALLFTVAWASGKLTIHGHLGLTDAVVFALQMIFGMFLSSASDDILIRGYLFRYLPPRLGTRAVVLLTAVAYVLNHFFRLRDGPNTWTFLFLLGLAFSLTVARTGSLWASIGIHWGGNVVDRLMEGLGDHPGVLVVTQRATRPWMGWINVLAATALLLAVLATLRRLRRNETSDSLLRPEIPSAETSPGRRR